VSYYCVVFPVGRCQSGALIYGLFMALHRKVDDHVIESLKEFLKLAEIGLSTMKADLSGDMAKDKGCLGAPAAVLLFSIIDAIGSYHRGDIKLKIKNHRRPYIDKDGYVQFFILNSHYFGQDLTGAEVIYFYGQYRSNLSQCSSEWRSSDL